MEKLTLKEIANHLLNDAKFKIKGKDEIYKSSAIYLMKNRIDFYNVKLNSDIGSCSIDEIELILHPLSDLTKEREVNGEKFVPFDVIANDEEYAYLEDDNIWVNDMFYSQILTDLSFIPYGVIQKLLEWHFDFQGLIQQNKAVDINTLNKQEV